MRRLLALVALLVTTWSNVGTVRCAPTTAASPEGHAHHGHAAPPAPATPDERVTASTDDDSREAESEPSSRPTAQECGLVMACGAALGGCGETLTRDIPGPLGETRPTSATVPENVTLSLDPPPPRRLT